MYFRARTPCQIPLPALSLPQSTNPTFQFAFILTHLLYTIPLALPPPTLVTTPLNMCLSLPLLIQDYISLHPSFSRIDHKFIPINAITSPTMTTTSKPPTKSARKSQTVSPSAKPTAVTPERASDQKPPAQPSKMSPSNAASNTAPTPTTTQHSQPSLLTQCTTYHPSLLSLHAHCKAHVSAFAKA